MQQVGNASNSAGRFGIKRVARSHFGSQYYIISTQQRNTHLLPKIGSGNVRDRKNLHCPEVDATIHRRPHRKFRGDILYYTEYA